MARVLLWSNAFWPLIGGVEVLSEKLTTTLSTRGHQLVVITDEVAGFPNQSDHNGVAIHRLPMLNAVNSGDVQAWVDVRTRVAAIKRAFQPDIVWDYLVQVDSMFHLMTERAWPAPTLATLHAAFAPDMIGETSAVRQVIDKAAWITACSAHALADTRRQMPGIGTRSSVMWNGLDMPRVCPTPLPFNPPTFLCLGRIGSKEEKGFDVAISAMRAVTARFPQARLIVAGDGAGRASLEEHAEHCRMSASVIFLGWVHPDKVYSLINEATAVLMPSRVPEGFGLAALQGQQMARPVVASRVGGVAEVVLDGDTGLLVNAGSVEALADAMLRLLEEPASATAMGATGRCRAESEFSFATHVDAYDALLQRLTSPVISLAPEHCNRDTAHQLHRARAERGTFHWRGGCQHCGADTPAD